MWQYLECIFMGQQDIQLLLQQEYAKFHRVHLQFKEEMHRIYNVKMCKEALITDINNSFLDKLK